MRFGQEIKNFRQKIQEKHLNTVKRKCVNVAVEITFDLEQTGYIVYPEDIVLFGTESGVYDDCFRLEKGEMSDDMLIYFPDSVERGVRVSISRSKMEFSLSLPTGREEIEDFYDYIKDICKLFRTDSFLRNGSEASMTGIEEYIEDDVAQTEKTLAEWTDGVNSGEYEKLCMLSAEYPVFLGKDELDQIGGTADGLDDFFAEKMNKDLFYSGAKVFEKPDGTRFGVYTMAANIETIFPDEPGLLVNEADRVDKWYVALNYNGGIRGQVPFEKAVEYFDRSERFDAVHFFVTPHTAELVDLLNNYSVDV